MWQQAEIQLPAMRRGFHLITDQVVVALLGEHRDHGGVRRMVLTLQGESLAV